MSALYLIGRALQGAAPMMELALLPAFAKLPDDEARRWSLAVAALIQIVGSVMVDAEDGIDPVEARTAIVQLAGVVKEFAPFLEAIPDVDADMMFSMGAKSIHDFADAIDNPDSFNMDPAEDAARGRAWRIFCVAVAQSRRSDIVVEPPAVEPKPKPTPLDKYGALRMPLAVAAATATGDFTPVKQLTDGVRALNRRGRKRRSLLRRWRR